jgi:RNA 3'-terminal phosphate cyclase-like protein
LVNLAARITFVPGLLEGGRIDHDCSLDRGLGYFLELLLCLGPYCKHPLDVTLRGVTNCNEDASPELLRSSGLNILKT